MQAARHFVEHFEAGGDAGDAAAIRVERFDRLDRFHDLLAHGGHLAFESIFADREDFLLHFVEQIVHLVLFFEGATHALRAGGDDLAQDEFVPDDLEVVGHVRGRRHEGEEIRDRRRAADRVERIPIAQDLRERDQVDALARVPEFHQRGIDDLVRRDVEILLVNFLHALRDDIARRDEHGTEHALLRLDAMRQRPPNILWGSCRKRASNLFAVPGRRASVSAIRRCLARPLRITPLGISRHLLIWCRVCVGSETWNRTLRRRSLPASARSRISP